MPRKRSPLSLPIDLGEVRFEPALPRPHIEYPGHHQAFLRFAEAPTGPFLRPAAVVRGD